MPGTIQVSVLLCLIDDVQTSSPHSSNTSIKVAMGKLEYQTSRSGDYIFPVTRLRENLIITLLDVNGNGISHKEIETRMIIESGFLDEKLSFNGYGNVQLKMQFVLSEEDRNRIRFLRQSALRKKHEELVNTNFLTKSKSIASDLSSLSPMKIRDTMVAARPETNLALSQETERKLKVKDTVEKTKSQVSSLDVSSSKKLLDGKKPESGSSVIKQEDKGLGKLERKPKRKSMRRSVSESNVRKMISTFEINVTQDTKIRTPKIQTKAQPVSSRKISSLDSVVVSRDEKTSIIEEQSLEQSTRRSDLLSKQRRKRSSVVEVKEDEKKQNKYARLKDSELEKARGSRLWIFPDESKDLKARHFDSAETELLQRKTVESTREDLQRRFHDRSNNKWKNIEKPKKQRSENPADTESSRGPVGQVMRALIVVGFAGLVFLTRQ